MDNTQKLQAVTEAIHKACPDLLELKFGTYVKFKTSFTGSLMTGRVGYIVKDCHIPWAGIFYDDTLEAKIDCKDLIILGQPIGIAEVLRAVGNRKMRLSYLDSDHNILVFTDHEGNRAYWNLTKTLDQQEEPVISLLYSIFYP